MYTTGKNLVAGVVLVATALRIRNRRSGVDASRGDPLRGAERLGLVAVAVVGGSVPFVLFFEGLARATSNDAAFIHKTLVVWVALLAVVVLGGHDPCISCATHFLTVDVQHRDASGPAQ